MTSIKTTLAGIALAAAAGLAAGPASTQPRLEQTGDGYSVVYDESPERGNVAGGRAAQVLGGGDDGAILYTGPDPAREGRFAALSGGGDDAALTYAEPSAPASLLAGGAGAGAASGRRG